MCKVSVILTSYNHEKYIHEAIDSVLNQTYIDLELIILDDCSTDNSWNIIKKYSDPRISAFLSEGYGQVVNRLNNAINELAKGDLIAIHHSDDVWELNKLEKQVAYLAAHPDIGAVFTWAQIFDENGINQSNNWFIKDNETQGQTLKKLFLQQNNLNHPSILIRKNCYHEVGHYRYGLAQTGDAEMWSRLLLKYPIHIIPELLTKHRIFSDNSNTSGNRTEVQIRCSNEWNELRENFLLITDFEFIVSIFPSLEKFRNPKGFEIKFLLAMACLYECNHRSAWQLGLQWLFELLNDRTKSDIIMELYTFSYLDYIKLTSEFDVYFIAGEQQQLVAFRRAIAENETIINAKNAELKEKQAELAELAAQYAEQAAQLVEKNSIISGYVETIAARDRTIHEIHSSSSWKLTQPLRIVSGFIRKT